MTRLVPNPQELVEQLRGLVAPTPTRVRDEPASIERILDAAYAAFSDAGVRATTMTRIARDAGVSREWLYRQFANRDAVAVAVAKREVGRFIDGLAVRAFAADSLDGAMVETFVYAVEFLRDHDLLQRVVRDEPGVLIGGMLEEGAPIVEQAVRAGAGYLSALGDLEPDEAVTVAEVLVRLVGSIVLVPNGAADLHDPQQLRRFAATVVPGVIAAARTGEAIDLEQSERR